MESAGLLIIVAVVIVGWRVVMHFVDTTRIRTYARMQGWREVSIGWQPFAPGWLGSRGQRHYQVFYTDSGGASYEKFAVTSLFGGLYWSDPDQ